MKYLLTALIFIFVTVFVCCVSRRRFGQCLPVSMLGTGLLIYLSRFLFGTFNVAYYVIYFVAVLAVIFFVFEYRRDKDRILGYVFSPGFWCFIAIIVLVYAYDYGRSLIEWDDRSHWAMMVKEMIRLDDWYCSPDSRLLVHQDYPPFAGCFEMFWCHIVGRYHESALLHGLHVLTLSLLTPCFVDGFENDESKESIGISILRGLIINILALFLIGIFDAPKLFRTSYTDILLGVMFVYGMSLLLRRRALNNIFEYIALIICSCSLLITKQMGIAFVLLIWLGFFIMTIVFRKEGKSLRGSVAKMVSLVIFPLMVRSLWSMGLKEHGISGQFDLSALSISKMPAVLADNGGLTLQRQTLNDFMHALVLNNITSFDITVTYLGSAIICLVILIMLYRHMKDIETRKETAVFMGTFICGTAGYAFTLSILYLFCFAEVEMRVLASYERYAACYVMAEFFVIIYMIWAYGSVRDYLKERSYIVGGILVLLILFSGSTFKIFIPAVFEPASNEEYICAAEALDQCTESNSSVFILSKDTYQSQFYINYYGESFRVRLDAEDYFDRDYSDKANAGFAMDHVFGCDYLYVKDVSDAFNEAFSSVNESGDFIEGKIYKITETDGIKTVRAVN